MQLRFFSLFVLAIMVCFVVRWLVYAAGWDEPIRDWCCRTWGFCCSWAHARPHTHR